ncbi:MAG: hypothetical protein NTX91_05250 [candidate division SR1 bacterium]|nr:hypothetical protein [candidate division SR1 bacterium]
MDTKHPGSEGSMQEVNGLEMAMLTYRGQIDENLPTVIKNCAGVDVVLLSQENLLSPDGSGKLLKEVILSKGKCLESRVTQTFTTQYYDENLQKKTLNISYKTNMPEDKKINFNDIGKIFLNIKRGFDLESTGRFTDARIGLMKYKGKYVRIGTFGLIKQVFDENPIPEATERLFIDEREVGDKNQIMKSQIEVPTMRAAFEINGREVYNNLAIKEKKYSNQYDRYSMALLCNEHHVDIHALWPNTEESSRYEDEYYLVYEEKLTDLSSRFAKMENIHMEYEANIPFSLYYAFPRSYREGYMKRKLFDKAINEWKNFSQWDVSKQKQIISEYTEKYADVELQLEDSYAVGNCEPGTESFINEYHLPKDKISIGKLSAKKNFSAMLENSRFRAVLLHKILTLTATEIE